MSLRSSQLRRRQSTSSESGWCARGMPYEFPWGGEHGEKSRGPGTDTRRSHPIRNSKIPTPPTGSMNFRLFFARFCGRRAARSLRHHHFPYSRETSVSSLGSIKSPDAEEHAAADYDLSAPAQRAFGTFKTCPTADTHVRGTSPTAVRTLCPSCRRRRIRGLRSWRPAGHGGHPRTASPARCGSACPAPLARSFRPTGRAR